MRKTELEYEVIADGLRFPEGPVIMADGCVIIVEIADKAITKIEKDGSKVVIAKPGGGPNGLALGPDGALYCCNNGGFNYVERQGLLIPTGIPEDYSGGRIERIDLKTGQVDILYTHVETEKGRYPLMGPNDIVFDKQGGFFFTDHGKTYERHTDLGGLYYAKTDGSLIEELAYHYISPNGVGLSPDEKWVYMADTLNSRLWGFELSAPLQEGGTITPANFLNKGHVIGSPSGFNFFDSLAVTASGNICVATIAEGGITTITPDGECSHLAIPDPFVTNIAFGGDDMRDAYITASGTGQLLKCRWPESGLRLNFQK